MNPKKAARKPVAYGLPTSLEAIIATSADVQKVMATCINADGSLKPEGIRSLLRARCVDIKALAKLHGTSDQYLHQVINRQRQDLVIEDLIAEKLGADANRIWGRQAVEGLSA